MAPSAIPPPTVGTKSLETAAQRPTIRRADTSNIGTRRKIICFSDFDGTICFEDTGHVLFNKFGCGTDRREVLDEQIKTGERSFRDVSEEMWGSLDVPFDDGFEVLQEALQFDPDFRTFHEFCLNNRIPFNVISAGLKPVLRRVLDHFLGEEASSSIDIVANGAEISADGSSWKPLWVHDTELGHDKAQSLQDWRAGARLASEDGTIPMIVFIGDGVSDLPAAREADVLFARRGLRLEEYCIEHKLAHIPFDTFADIQKEIIQIMKVDDAKTKGQGLPSNFNPRANMWRRASSKKSVPLYAALTPREEKKFVWPEVFAPMANQVGSQTIVEEALDSQVPAA